MKDNAMKKRLLVCTVAAIAFAGAAPTYAADQAAGAATGAAGGAVTGALVGGPVGAAVGGVAGAIIGSAASVPHRARTYVVQHPVQSVQVHGDLSEGYEIPRDVEIHTIPHEPSYGYVYVDKRPVIVKKQSRKVVYASAARDTSGETTGAVSAGSPPRTVITYVERHHAQPVQLKSTLRVGRSLPSTVELRTIPRHPAYAYVYTESGPVIVKKKTRTVVWTR